MKWKQDVTERVVDMRDIHSQPLANFYSTDAVKQSLDSASCPMKTGTMPRHQANVQLKQQYREPRYMTADGVVVESAHEHHPMPSHSLGVTMMDTVVLFPRVNH